MLLTPTRTANVAVLDDGCAVTRVLPDIEQTPADATENLKRAVEACAGQRRPLLLDLSRAVPLEAEVRHFYSGRILVESFLALAVLVDGSPFGRMMGNVYLRVARPGIPTRLFADEAGALHWLRKFVS
jgi:hypothetical protein